MRSTNLFFAAAATWALSIGDTANARGVAIEQLHGGFIGGPVLAMEVYDGGDGERVYAGGDFVVVSGGSARRIARQNSAGDAFVPMGSGLHDGPYNGQPYASALARFGDDLIFGGKFERVSGVEARNIAAWDGAGFRSLGVVGWVTAMCVYNDGGGARLHVAHYYQAGGLEFGWSAWDGATMTEYATPPLDHKTYAIAQFDDGSGAGPALVAGGHFTSSDGVAARKLASWRPGDATWLEVGGGVIGGDVLAMTVTGEAPDSTLYIGGDFTKVDGNISAKGLAAWDGEAWTTFGVVVGTVRAIAWWDDNSGHGAELYIAGDITSVGGVAVSNLARRRDGAWEPVANIDGSVRVLSPTMLAGAPALLVAGEFTLADGVTVNSAFALRSAEPKPCPGDTNGDNVIDFQDLNAVISAFNTVSAEPGYSAGADVDGDGDVDFADLNVVVSNFNTDC